MRAGLQGCRMQIDKSMRGGGFEALQFAYVFTTSCKRSLELGTGEWTGYGTGLYL